MEKKGTGIAAVNGETQLGEFMIEHIQSFMTGKQGERTTMLSKSWYNTWLTRPTLDFDERDFKKGEGFVEFATNTMQRYRHSNLRIDSFKLRINNTLSERVGGYLTRMIVDAFEIGATYLHLNLNLSRPVNLASEYVIIDDAASVLPKEVFGCETLTRLSVTDAKIDERSVSGIACCKLKSLSLERVHTASESVISDVFSSCVWIEELSLCDCTTFWEGVILGLPVLWRNTTVCKLQNLKSLSMKGAVFNSLFFSNLGCFPCLKDLKVAAGYRLKNDVHRWTLASSSLQHISFVDGSALTLEFDVPNIRSFVYSGWDLPDVTFKSVGSREWESHITAIGSYTYRPRSWISSFNELLTSLRPSRIFLTVDSDTWERLDCEGKGDITRL